MKYRWTSIWDNRMGEYLFRKQHITMKTKEMILKRLEKAKELLEQWELSIEDYNKFVKHCRKLLHTLKTKWLAE